MAAVLPRVLLRDLDGVAEIAGQPVEAAAIEEILGGEGVAMKWGVIRGLPTSSDSWRIGDAAHSAECRR